MIQSGPLREGLRIELFGQLLADLPEKKGPVPKLGQELLPGSAICFG